MFSVIIVSAGKSTRMNGINKQFLELDGIPVLIRSAMAFDTIQRVKEIIIVTSSDLLEKTKNLFDNYKFNKYIKFAVGGNTRQKSVFSGFKLVDENSDYVAIHDGARPLITHKTINDVFDNTVKYKASTAGVPVKDTIKTVFNEFIESTPPRESLFITQTPQAFEKALYCNAMSNALQKNCDYTDDCQLIESLGSKVYMTVGEYTNIKITTPEDIVLAEKYSKDVLK